MIFLQCLPGHNSIKADIEAECFIASSFFPLFEKFRINWTWWNRVYSNSFSSTSFANTLVSCFLLQIWWQNMFHKLATWSCYRARLLSFHYLLKCGCLSHCVENSFYIYIKKFYQNLHLIFWLIYKFAIQALFIKHQFFKLLNGFFWNNLLRLRFTNVSLDGMACPPLCKISFTTFSGFLHCLNSTTTLAFSKDVVSQHILKTCYELLLSF
jgi:hypothetical protein